MQNLNYAGIGTQQPTAEGATLVTKTAEWLARHDYVVHTGGADGVDQLFSSTALRLGGHAVLHLPWARHAEQYLASIPADQLDRLETRVLQTRRSRRDHEALASVDQHHPDPSRLSWGGRCMHARNYRIVVPAEPVAFVVALPLHRGGRAVGGTLQGIRIAERLGIPVVRLDRLTQQQALDQIRALAGIGGLWG